MIVLTLQPGKHTSKLISKFNQYLEFNNLRVIEQQQNLETNNIELTINAQSFNQIQRATALSQRFFASKVVSVKRATPVLSNVTNIETARPSAQTDQLTDYQLDNIAA